MGRPREGWKLRDPREPGDPFTVRFTDKEGHPRELTTGTSDPSQAALRAADLYAKDLTTGIVVGARIDPTLSFDELLAAWLADLETTHDPETVKTYTQYAREYVRHFKTFAGITVAKMGDFQRWQLGRTVRDTVSKKRSAMNGFLDWCVEQHVLREEDRPRWPKLPKKATGVRTGPQRENPVDVTREQVRDFLAALPIWSKHRLGRKHAIRPYFVFAYETGLRPETLATLEIPKHWTPGAETILIDDANDKARFGRRVPITAGARAALELTAAELGTVEGPIFGRHDYREVVEKARRAAGIHEDFAPYDLRHGRIGHLLDEPGAELRAVMFLVGHLLMTTTNRYVRGQADGAAKLLNSIEFRGDTGETTPMSASAKEGTRTLTGVTPPEPESGATDQQSNAYNGIGIQDGSGKLTLSQGFGDIPETKIPKSVGDAARFLAVLRASDDALEAALASEMIADLDGLPR